MGSKAVQKTITLPANLLYDVEERVGRLGLSISEYFRFLAFNDTEKIRNLEFKLSSGQEKSIASSIKDFKEGNYIVLENNEDIDKL